MLTFLVLGDTGEHILVCAAKSLHQLCQERLLLARVVAERNTATLQRQLVLRYRERLMVVLYLHHLLHIQALLLRNILA